MPEARNRNISGRSLGGLDWFTFFVADVQTGWGPFVAAYLTSQGWLQFDIGLILTIGTMAAFALQVPLGALVDWVSAKRLLAAVAVSAISASALLLAVLPVFNAVVVAKLLHAVASCLLGGSDVTRGSFPSAPRSPPARWGSWATPSLIGRSSSSLPHWTSHAGGARLHPIV